MRFRRNFFRSVGFRFGRVLFPNIQALVSGLGGRDVDVTLTSSSSESLVGEIVASYWLRQVFCMIMDERRFGSDGPGPSVFLVLEGKARTICHVRGSRGNNQFPYKTNLLLLSMGSPGGVSWGVN